MTIGKKLYLGFGAALVITLIMGITAIRNINALGTSIDALAHISARNLFLAGEINNLTSDFLAAQRGMLLRAHANDKERARKMYDHALEDAAALKKDDAEFIQRSTKPDLRDLVQTHVQDKIEPMLQVLSTLNDMALRGDLAGADALSIDKFTPLAQEASDAGDELAPKEYQQVMLRADTASAIVTPARNLSILMMVLSMAVGAGITWIVRKINSTLQSSVGELRDGADQVANAASQVSSSSQSLAQGASEQAASLEETSASSEEINSMARKNTDNSRATAELLAQSQQKVNQANHHLEDMVASMNQITDSSGKISKIIKVIDEIAFQTNILALNAAVEAARAGEAGMGFAVVADEVRSLAQRSAQAAKDTAILIEDSIAKSSEGKVKVDQVAHAIKAVTEDSARIKVMVDEVSLGSEEQSRGIDQIGKAISQMEQVTQTTAANAEESAAAAEQLNAQSEAMKDVVAQLQAMVGGAGSDSRPMMRIAPARSTRPSRPSIQGASSLTKISRPASLQKVKIGYGGSTSVRKPAVEADEFPMEESFQSF